MSEDRYVMSREVCKRCREARGLTWVKSDDMVWGPWMLDSGSLVSGRVSCIHGGGGVMPSELTVRETWDIPPECPYITEHVVCGETWESYFNRLRAVSVYELHEASLDYGVYFTEPKGIEGVVGEDEDE